MLDPYVYPGTNILRNILDIQDWQSLNDAEADYVSLRLRELAENPLEGNYDVLTERFSRNTACTSGLRLSLTRQYFTI